MQKVRGARPKSLTLLAVNDIIFGGIVTTVPVFHAYFLGNLTLISADDIIRMFR
jgi:hypothetical protein